MHKHFNGERHRQTYILGKEALTARLLPLTFITDDVVHSYLYSEFGALMRVLYNSLVPGLSE
jgi:hypothetical protein